MDDDPVRQSGAWWDDAEVPMFDERGFCFWTHRDSPTGEQLARNPRAALVWLWDGRQAASKEPSSP